VEEGRLPRGGPVRTANNRANRGLLHKGDAAACDLGACTGESGGLRVGRDPIPQRSIPIGDHPVTTTALENP